MKRSVFKKVNDSNSPSTFYAKLLNLQVHGSQDRDAIRLDTAEGAKLSKEIALLSRHIGNRVRNKTTLEPGLDTLLNSNQQLGLEESSEIKLTFMGNTDNMFTEDEIENY